MRLENLFLKKLLEIAARSSPKLKIRPTDRFFLCLLTDLPEFWRDATWLVKPDPLTRWHPENFRLFSGHLIHRCQRWGGIRTCERSVSDRMQAGEFIQTRKLVLLQ